MTRPGLIVMMVIAVAVSIASLGGGQRELFAPEAAEKAQ